MEKRCTKCGEVKLFTDFTTDNKKADKLTVWCKMCSKASRDAYYEKNKDSIKVKHLAWRQQNKELIRAKRIEKRKEDPRKTMLYSAKHRAMQKGLDFDLKLEDLVIPEVCPVLGTSFDFNSPSQSRFSPSLDRIDSSKGYTKDNIQIISWLANSMKSDATPEQLLNFANWIIEFFKDKNE